jgi:hypothetical protein
MLYAGCAWVPSAAPRRDRARADEMSRCRAGQTLYTFIYVAHRSMAGAAALRSGAPRRARAEYKAAN